MGHCFLNDTAKNKLKSLWIYCRHDKAYFTPCCVGRRGDSLT